MSEDKQEVALTEDARRVVHYRVLRRTRFQAYIRLLFLGFFFGDHRDYLWWPRHYVIDALRRFSGWAVILLLMAIFAVGFMIGSGAEGVIGYIQGVGFINIDHAGEYLGRWFRLAFFICATLIVGEGLVDSFRIPAKVTEQNVRLGRVLVDMSRPVDEIWELTTRERRRADRMIENMSEESRNFRIGDHPPENDSPATLA